MEPEEAEAEVVAEAISHLNVAWYNCAGGLLAKIDSIKIILDLTIPDILFLSEIEIKDETDTSLFNIKGYSLIISGSLQKFGHARTGVYIKSSIALEAGVSLYESEVIGIRVGSVLLAGTYRQFKLWPGQSHKNELVKMLAIISELVQKNDDSLPVIGGDFNLDWLRKHDAGYHAHGLMSHIEEWADDLGFNQLIKTETRHREIVKSTGERILEKACLDLIFTNDPDRVATRVEPGLNSDHDIILATVRLDKTLILNVRKKISCRDWRNYDLSKVIAQANKRPITLCPRGSIEEWASSISSALTKITDAVAPLRVIKINCTNDLENSRVSALKKKRD